MTEVTLTTVVVMTLTLLHDPMRHRMSHTCCTFFARSIEHFPFHSHDAPLGAPCTHTLARASTRRS